MSSERGSSAAVFLGGVLAVLGVLFLLVELDVFEVEIKYVAPILLIVMGLGLAFKGAGARGGWEKREVEGDGTFANYRPRKPTKVDS